MSKNFSNIQIHIIFHTKSGACAMREVDLPQIYRYVVGTIRTMSGYAHIVGGRPDHLHILSSLPVDISLADFVRSIKANTSRWIKTLDAYYHDFAWQTGYGAFSVSISNKERVMKYISEQKEHHQKQTTQEEFTSFLKKHGIQPMHG